MLDLYCMSSSFFFLNSKHVEIITLEIRINSKLIAYRADGLKEFSLGTADFNVILFARSVRFGDERCNCTDELYNLGECPDVSLINRADTNERESFPCLTTIICEITSESRCER